MLNLPFFRKKNYNIKPVVLLILDGFGLAPPSQGNAITLAKTPNYDEYLKNYPHSELIASGESVGLPANEVGNTEVGHLTLGAGRVILQDLKRIDLAIEKGSFYDNKALLALASHVKENNSKLHVLGLASSGKVHSSINHLFAILQFCKKEGISRVFLHLFTDGRDAPPKEGAEIIERIERHLQTIKLGEIASICGRYYAMDRDRRWDRTERAYNAIVLGQGIQAVSALDAVNSGYARNQTDEFIEPTVIVDARGPKGIIEDNDGVIFFNYRIDRPRQLTMAMVLPDFENLKVFDFGYNPEVEKEEGEVTIRETFKRGKIVKNLFFVTLTEYHRNLPVSAVAFPSPKIVNSLGQVISENGLRQLRMAESEKERFITYYFDGLRETPYHNEDFVIVPSPKVETYDKKPEMALPNLLAEFKKQIAKDRYHFIAINFANPDMVAHSGNLPATVKAIEFTDYYMGELVRAVLAQEGIVLITADHGNAEELLTFPTTTYFYTSNRGTINTDHSNNPVPFIGVSKLLYGKVAEFPRGELSDVAPSILGLLGLPKPEEMTGKEILSQIINKNSL